MRDRAISSDKHKMAMEIKQAERQREREGEAGTERQTSDG
jgi:hypothetical protein